MALKGDSSCEELSVPSSSTNYNSTVDLSPPDARRFQDASTLVDSLQNDSTYRDSRKTRAVSPMAAMARYRSQPGAVSQASLGEAFFIQHDSQSNSPPGDAYEHDFAFLGQHIHVDENDIHGPTSSRNSGFSTFNDSTISLTPPKGEERAAFTGLDGVVSPDASDDTSTPPSGMSERASEESALSCPQTPCRASSNHSQESNEPVGLIGPGPVRAPVLPDDLSSKLDHNLIFLADCHWGHAFGCDLKEPLFFSRQTRGLYHSHHGLHFVWTSRFSSDSPRSGFFFFTKPSHNGSLKILQWNDYVDTLGPHAVVAEERDLLAHAPVICKKPEQTPAEMVEDSRRAYIWTMMTYRITPEVLSRIISPTPSDWKLKSSDPIGDAADRHCRLDAERQLSIAFHGNQLTFAFADKTISLHNHGSVDHQDTTELLLKFIDGHERWTTEVLLAEFQFLFVAGVFGGNDSCMELWLKMVQSIVLGTFSLPRERPVFALDLLVCFGHQLRLENFDPGRILNEDTDFKTKIRQALVIYKMRLTDTCLSDRCQSQTHASIAMAFSDIEQWFGGSYGDDLRGHYIKVSTCKPRKVGSLAGLVKSAKDKIRGRSDKLPLTAVCSSEELKPEEKIVPAPVHYFVKKGSALLKWS